MDTMMGILVAANVAQAGAIAILWRAYVKAKEDHLTSEQRHAKAKEDHLTSEQRHAKTLEEIKDLLLKKRRGGQS